MLNGVQRLLRATKLLAVILAMVLTTPSAHATTSGDAIISPENQHQLITDWGYDIKEGGKAAGLTPTLAHSFFVDDRMTLLRMPIYGNISVPAHPGPGIVIASYYTDVLTAMTNARAANPKVIFFASKKSDSNNTYPGWVKDSSNNIVPVQYARMVGDFLQFMHANGFDIDVLGVENEGYYTEDNMTPQQVSDTISTLKTLSGTLGFKMPPRTIWPEGYNPDTGRLATAVNSYGTNLQIAGTHYYPDARPLSSLQLFVKEAGPRPVWHSEVHWGNTYTNVISQAEQNFATIFDCTDTGLSSFTWWAYTRTGLQGSLEQAITTCTAGSHPIDIDDLDGTGATRGTLITRAFRRGPYIYVWAINNTSTDHASYGFKLDIGSIIGNVAWQQWTSAGASTGFASITASNTFRQTLPAGTATLFTFSYRPPPAGINDSDGDGLSDWSEVSSGFDPSTPNIVFTWVGSVNGGDGYSLYNKYNWQCLQNGTAVLNIGQNVLVNHDLLCTNGIPGGGSGFGASLNINWRTFSMEGGTLRAQSNAGIRGTSAGKLRIGGQAVVLLKFLDTIRAETTGDPQIIFYTANAFTNGATLNVLGLSHPTITIRQTTTLSVQSQFLPSLYINGTPADLNTVRLTVVNGTDVLITVIGNTTPPHLTVAPANADFMNVSWPNYFPQFAIETTSDLRDPWSVYVPPISNDGTNLFFIAPASANTQFFRLQNSSP